MKKVVFTIVAKNYTGLACLLGQSVLANSPETDFYIVIADEIGDDFKLPDDRYKCVVAKNVLNITEDKWHEMAFKYTITEFCTSIKPFCFSFFFGQNDVEKVIYFDPDILVFSSLEIIWNTLNNKFAVITPHVLTLQNEFTGPARELDIMLNGIYNLGFIAFKNNEPVKKVVDWWQKRLEQFSYVDKHDGVYTDQKWINFLPVFLPAGELEISHNLGYNVAPWNFFEREITKQDDDFYVINRINAAEKNKLVFVHYSGFDYKNLSNNAKNKNIPALEIYTDIELIMQEYVSYITKSNISDYLALTYTYNFFSNGQTILFFYRRLYRRIKEDGENVVNPFIAEGQNTFYALLKKAHLIVNIDDFNPDKLSDKNMPGFEGKLYKLNIFHKTLMRLLGAKNYFMYTKFMQRYYRPENQVFFIMQEYMRNNYNVKYS